MKKINMPSSAFTAVIIDAIKALQKQDLQVARTLIGKAALLDMDAPEPHNLLGILYELQSDDNSARKHYRAAYALDPTYTPAIRNLERLVIFEWGTQKRNYDYGDYAFSSPLPDNVTEIHFKK